MFNTLMLKFSEDAVPYAYQVFEETFRHFEYLTKISEIPQEDKPSILRQIADYSSKVNAQKLQAQIEAHIEELRFELEMEERKTSAMNQARKLFHGLDTP